MWTALAIEAVVGVLAIVWLIDDLWGPDEVRRGTRAGGIDVGGRSPDDVAGLLTPLAAELSAIEVELVLDGDAVVTSASELGISLDTASVAAEAAEQVSGPLRPFAWLSDFFGHRDIDLALTTEVDQITAAVRRVGGDPDTPRIRLVEGELVPVIGAQIPDVDMPALVSLLEGAVLDSLNGAAAEPVKVAVPTSGTRPADPDASLRAVELAAEANRITAEGVRLHMLGTTASASLDPEHLRPFIRTEGTGLKARLALDSGISDTLADIFDFARTESSEASFDVDFSDDASGAVVIRGGEPGYECCDPQAADVLLAGLEQLQPVIVLPSVASPHPRGREWAESLGITQIVGEFTTPFRPGQQRVINIDRISEITRGALIAPGEQFSLNDFVGPRTREKGFVSAGVIAEGVFTNAVGGGISQFATTLFNAAFFAGLEFVDYQSHSIYISRYPYGREATVSYGEVDLVFENNTPYTLMLWPTTTPSSVTVRIYSTPWIIGEQTAQYSRQQGIACTRVTTTRTRTWLNDGHTETDTVFAVYRPEGVKCDGTPSVTTTTLPEDADDVPDDDPTTTDPTTTDPTTTTPPEEDTDPPDDDNPPDDSPTTTTPTDDDNEGDQSDPDDTNTDPTTATLPNNTNDGDQSDDDPTPITPPDDTNTDPTATTPTDNTIKQSDGNQPDNTSNQPDGNQPDNTGNQPDGNQPDDGPSSE